MSDKKENRSDELVKSTGRGVIYITFAKLWFMMTGFVLTFGLPRIFKWAADGDADQGQQIYGVYGLVFMAISFVNNPIITGTLQSVSKFTSENEANILSVKRTALKIQGLMGVGLALIYVIFAPFFAQWLGSPSLTNLMRLSSVIIVAYSYYAVFIGSFNGQRMYHKQALFDVGYSTIKTCLIIAMALAGYEVLGAVFSFVAAAFLIAIIAAMVSGTGSGSFSSRRYFSYAIVLFIYTFLLNLVMSLDLFIMKALASDTLLDAGATQEAAIKASEMMAGQYKAAQGLALIPYMAILSIAFVIFPMISKVSFAQDTKKTFAYIQKTMRLSSILIFGLASVLASLPQQTLGFVYPSEYEVASDALRILALGIAAFGLMVVGNTILNGSGRLKSAMIGIVVSLLSLIVAVVGFLLSAEDSNLLTATAKGSAIGWTIGLLLAGIAMYRSFGTFWPWRTALRVLIASAVAISAGYFMPTSSRVVTLAECLAVLVVYFVVLVATMEFKKEDALQLKQILKVGK